LAFTEVNVFKVGETKNNLEKKFFFLPKKFADKVTTYFQCAVSTCMISEGMCSGKTVEIIIL